MRRGCKVRIWDEPDQVLYRVDKLNGDEALITSLTEPPAQRRLPRSALVVVREFGDPVYPGLVSTGRVHYGGDKAAHIVINAENFHALETLLYTHEGKVDAIYIDNRIDAVAKIGDRLLALDLKSEAVRKLRRGRGRGRGSGPLRASRRRLLLTLQDPQVPTTATGYS